MTEVGREGEVIDGLHILSNCIWKREDMWGWMWDRETGHVKESPLVD